MKPSDGLLSFKKMSFSKKLKPESSSSSSSSSLGVAAHIVSEPEPGGSIKDTLLTMGHAMENALVGDKMESHTETHHHKRREGGMKDAKMDKKGVTVAAVHDHEEEGRPSELQPALPSSPPPENQLDFLQRRKLAAAQMRTRKESEMEKDSSLHPPLLNLHYLPPVLQDAASLNLVRFQTAQAWAKAQERVVEMKLNKFRRKKKDSLISNAKGLLKKTWKYLDKSTEHFTKFKLWAKDLKWMECSFGSSMMITFAFLRWVFLLNLILGLIWFCAIVLPFILQPPKEFNWTVFKAALAQKKFLLALQGIGIDKSFLYYGGYLYAKGEQFGWYHTDYMYPLTIVATTLISLLAVLGRITIRILETGSKTLGASGNVLYPFATLTFATWDFHLTTFEGATIMRRGIRMQFRERLADDKNKKAKTNEKPATLIKRYFALFILWPMLLAVSAGCEYCFVTYANEISDRIGIYGDSVLISLVNNLSPRLVKALVHMEDWKPAVHEKMTIMKLYFLRILNLSTILYRSYLVLWASWAEIEGKAKTVSCTSLEDCNDSFICCTSANIGEWHLCTSDQVGFCVAGCTENWMASELLGMIVITTLMNVGVAILQALFYLLWYKTKGSLDITDFVVDIVYMQALVWITSVFSPLASLVGCFSNLVTFICFKNVLFYTCKPVQKPYSASRTSNLTYGMLLSTLLFSIIPISIEFTTASAAFCGPIQDRISMYTVLNNYIKEAPKVLTSTMNILSNTWLQWSAILGLVLGLVVMRAKLKQSYIFASLTRRELEMSRRFNKDGSDYKRLSVEEDVGINIPH